MLLLNTRRRRVLAVLVSAALTFAGLAVVVNRGDDSPRSVATGPDKKPLPTPTTTKTRTPATTPPAPTGSGGEPVPQTPAGKPPLVADVSPTVRMPVAIPTQATPTTHPERAADHFVAPGGSGEDCTQSRPCGTFDAALKVSSPGDVVEAAPGTYPQLKLLKGVAKPVGTEPVLLRGASTSSVTVEGLILEVPGVDVALLTVQGDVRVRKTATGTRLDRLSVRGIVDIEASKTVLVASRVQPPPDRDALSIREGAAGVEIVSNVIGPGLRTNGTSHVDCMQVSWATGLRVVGNVMFRCATQTIIIKPDRGPITDVLVSDNVLQGCVQRTSECDGFNALAVRLSGANEFRDVRIVQNTIDGGVTFDDFPGLELSRNVMTDQPCLAGSTDNVFPPNKSCGAATTGTGPPNLMRTILFLGRDGMPPDLRLDPVCACSAYGAQAGE